MASSGHSSDEKSMQELTRTLEELTLEGGGGVELN